MIRHALILIAIIAAVKSETECSDENIFDKCLEKEVDVPFIALPKLPNEEFLNKQCRPATEMLECARDILKKCPEAGVHVIDTVESLELGLNFLHSVCDEDSVLKKSYLENVGCYNTILPKTAGCKNRTKVIVFEFYGRLTGATADEDDIHPWCLYGPMLYSCILEESIETCGAEATSPLDNIFAQLASLFKVMYECPSDDKLAEWQLRFTVYLAEKALELTD